jgi:hypothetical protein
LNSTFSSTCACVNSSSHTTQVIPLPGPPNVRLALLLDRERQEAERKRVEAQGIADFQTIVARGISSELLKWKAIEVAHELSKSPNAKLVILGDKTGLPIILSDK